MQIPSQFEWDEAKRRLNIQSRGLDFVDAIGAFSDVRRMIWEDCRRDYGEVRFNMLARTHGRVVHVTFTLRGAVVRIISFRKANERERRRYEP
jgi:uncharacterized DUF497 family protein